MADLIAITDQTIGHKTIPAVDARDLHRMLGLRKQFSHWIDQIIGSGDWLEHHDFGVIAPEDYNSPGPGRPQERLYIFSMEMAEHVAMMTHTPRGRDVRNYFRQARDERDALTRTPLPQQTYQQQLADIQAFLDFLTRLRQANERDALMCADMARTLLPRTLGLTGQGQLPAPRGFDLADRTLFLGYILTRSQQATLLPAIGKAVAAEYRDRYTREPEKTPRYVDGKTRGVGFYLDAEASWIDTIIQTICAQHGVGATP